MSRQLYETFAGDEITDSMLDEVAKLFSENYGTWGEHSHRPGKPVKLSGHRLREQYLPNLSVGYHVRVTVDGNLAGSTLACRWKQDDKSICWITQLVVHRNYRGVGLASGLLRTLLAYRDDVYGIMSSHPFACLAAASTFGGPIDNVSLDFIRENAETILRTSPIPYIRDAKLCGTLFEPQDSTGIICGADTKFFVDHEEPLNALKIVQGRYNWPLGELSDGQEYLLILPSKYCRLRRRSSGRPEKDVVSSC